MKIIRFWVLVSLVQLQSGRAYAAVAKQWQQNPKIDSSTLWHFLVSGGGTIIGSQLYQYYGMDRTPANVIAPLEMLGVGLVKGFLIDTSLKPYSFAGNGLGLIVGSLANVSVRFDYARQSKRATNVSSWPSRGSPLSLSYRDIWPYKTHPNS